MPEDDAEAVRWYGLAAEQGVAEAQHNLGFSYLTERGVPQDYVEAVRWFRLAAEQGHARAQSDLGLMYTNGDGVPQDYVQAHMWLNRAASRATGEVRERAVNNRDIVAGRMTPAQLAEAQRLSRERDAPHPRERETCPVEAPAAKRCTRHVYLINQEIKDYAESNTGPDGNNDR